MLALVSIVAALAGLYYPGIANLLRIVRHDSFNSLNICNYVKLATQKAILQTLVLPDCTLQLL